jgi:hypothetical protein
MARSYAAIGGFGEFTVTPSVVGSQIRMTISDSGNKLTTSKMIKAVLGDAIDQWLATNAAQLVTNGVSVGNDPSHDIGGADGRFSGDGYWGWDFNFSGKRADTPDITTTSLTTDAITVAVPYADAV